MYRVSFQASQLLTLGQKLNFSSHGPKWMEGIFVPLNFISDQMLAARPKDDTDGTKPAVACHHSGRTPDSLRTKTSLLYGVDG